MKGLCRSDISKGKPFTRFGKKTKESCHQQAHGFSDLPIASTGVNGTTDRHSMRLINARFAEESRFFWDERAATLKDQSTEPIQDLLP